MKVTFEFDTDKDHHEYQCCLKAVKMQRVLHDYAVQLRGFVKHVDESASWNQVYKNFGDICMQEDFDPLD